MKKRGESPQNCVWKKKCVCGSHSGILETKESVKEKISTPRGLVWYINLAVVSWARVTNLFFEEEKDVCLTGEETGGHEMIILQPPALPTPPPPTPPPSKKNRNEKNTHLCVFQEDVEYVWVRAHVVLARTVSKDEIQASGLWRGECLKTIQALWSARHPAALLHSLIASCRFSDPKLS